MNLPTVRLMFGTASNATAGWCNFKWEFRPMPGEDGQLIINEVQTYAKQELLPAMQLVHPLCEINIITEAPVPALNDSNASLATELVSHITGLNSTGVVSFGTDAGYFSILKWKSSVKAWHFWQSL